MLALGAGGVWFAGARRGVSAPIEEAKFERIDPATGAVDRTFDTTHRRAVVARRARGCSLVDRLPGRAHPRRGAIGRRDRGDAAVDIGIYGD